MNTQGIPNHIKAWLDKGSRVLVWFSCGAASSVAAKLVSNLATTGMHVEYLYCDTLAEEHPDNIRYLADIARYIGSPIKILKSNKYTSISDVFEKTRYMAGINGAACTAQMKKIPRFSYQNPTDIHVFGFTYDEAKRLDRFYKSNPDLIVWDVLGALNMTKTKCLSMLQDAGILLPQMYALGFKNNNCIGCVKAQSPAYWNMVRKHFPEIWNVRNDQSRRLNVRLAKLHGVRVFLDEIPYDDQVTRTEEDVSCGPQCSSEKFEE